MHEQSNFLLGRVVGNIYTVYDLSAVSNGIFFGELVMSSSVHVSMVLPSLQIGS